MLNMHWNFDSTRCVFIRKSELKLNLIDMATDIDTCHKYTLLESLRLKAANGTCCSPSPGRGRRKFNEKRGKLNFLRPLNEVVMMQ